MKLRSDYTCPLELTQDMIKGKWKPILLWRLRFGPASPSRLEQEIVGINQKMLLEQLRELIDFGLVEKKVYEGYPLRVEYSLTEDRGRDVLRALEILQEVGIHYMVDAGQEEVLRQKGIDPSEYTQKSG